MKYLLLFLCLSASAQSRLHIARDGFYVTLGVEDPEAVQSVALQRSTNLINWQVVNLAHYYEGWGHQTNYVIIEEPGYSFFRLVPLSTNPVFSVITSLARPATNYQAWLPFTINGQQMATMVWSNDCMTATINYKVPTGTWAIERNFDLRGQWTNNFNCINGDYWRRIGPFISGPSSNMLTLALPASNPGYLRLRKL